MRSHEADIVAFWNYVEKTAGCWLWKAAKATNGYGRAWFRKHLAPAHRVAYQLLVGPIPQGLQLDHLCRNRACVNPSHLEPVTNKENGRRGIASEVNRARWLARTHCKNGHAYNDENTLMVTHPEGHIYRSCRPCRRERVIKWRAGMVEAK